MSLQDDLSDQNHVPPFDTLFPNVPGGNLEDFETENGFTVTWYNMIPFWDAYRPWLTARGVYLFEIRLYGTQECWGPPPPPTHVAALPYATCADCKLQTSFPLTPSAKIAPARNQYGQDVMLKVTQTNSAEYRIYHELLSCNELFEDDFQGVLPPVAILDTQHEFSFIVMPRWGPYNPLTTIETVDQVLVFMRCLLKGLALLHSRRVAHRDIDNHNIMVNCYSLGTYGDKFAPALREHRRGSSVWYCLLDFDRSVQFPMHMPIGSCRLPADAVGVSATPYQPPDLIKGEYDYDPFAFDVACLGNMFRANFFEVIPAIPMLAPLFDQMTTHVKSHRLKAADALTFLEDSASQLPTQTLDMQVQLRADWAPLDDPTLYWSKLPPDFSTTWGVYRTPPLSRLDRLLYFVAQYEIGWHALHLLRRTLRI